ncbi:MAG TPA: hypothetical protein VFH31_01885 [Pyrinomonadaceae bacterium]|nr:hypothetical protein [Pyrinomonadaceae bacterium]
MLIIEAMAKSAPKRTKRNRPHAATVKAPMPASLERMLPTLIRRPFSDPNWIYEPKWDGWRALCFIRDGQARFLSRKKNSLNERFPELRDIAKLVKADTVILDGEIVALDAQGIPRFEGLHHRKQNFAVVYYSFDVLYLDGFDLTQCPLIVRKKALKKILPRGNTSRIRFTDHITGKGEPLFEKLEASRTGNQLQRMAGRDMRPCPR